MKKHKKAKGDQLIWKAVLLTLLFADKPLPEPILKARTYILYRALGGKKKW